MQTQGSSKQNNLLLGARQGETEGAANGGKTVFIKKKKSKENPNSSWGGSLRGVQRPEFTLEPGKTSRESKSREHIQTSV